MYTNLANTLMKYIKIDAESFHERKMADTLKEELLNLGFYVEEDHANEIYDSECGNIYGYLKGELKGSVLLCAHMDTVSPGMNKKPIYDKDTNIITSDGTTVLGGDNLNNVVSILESIKYLKDNNIKHKDIEVVFTIAEEKHCRGIAAFDLSKIQSKEAYIFDMSGDVGSIALKAPSIIQFDLNIHGRAAHAGFEPERGLNSIQVLSNIISSLKQGRIDEETTMNIGKIEGGISTNIICEDCLCIGEVRSFNHQKALNQIEYIEQVVKEHLLDGMSYTYDINVYLKAYELKDDNVVVNNFIEACKSIGIDSKLRTTFGGSDNNEIMNYGINGCVLSCGMYNVHSTKEYIKVDEVYKVIQIIKYLLTIIE